MNNSDKWYGPTINQTAGLLMETNPLDIADYLEQKMTKRQYDEFVSFMINKALQSY